MNSISHLVKIVRYIYIIKLQIKLTIINNIDKKCLKSIEHFSFMVGILVVIYHDRLRINKYNN